MQFSSTIEQLNKLDVTEVIGKICGDKVTIVQQGNYITVNPCPKCGHNDCCKVNADNNTTVCFSECNRKYMDTIHTTQWLLDSDEKEAVMWLAENFDVELPEEFEQVMEKLQKEKRILLLMKRFAEFSHQDMTPSERKYWTDRGLSDETIDNWMIGICRYDSTLYDRLVAEGFAEEELKGSGLFNRNIPYFAMTTGRETFSYYTLPNISKGNIIDIQGRLATVTDNKEIPRYRTMTGKVESFFNPDALRENTIFIAEGIPDTLSLIQMGFPAVGAYGAGSVKDEWLPLLRKDKRVFIVFDNDDAGRKSAYKLAKSVGATARIVTLPEEVNDVNELLVCLGTDDAKVRIAEAASIAMTYLQMDMQKLPKDNNQCTEAQIQYLVSEINKVPLIYRDDYITELVKYFGKGKKHVDALIKHYGGTKDSSEKTGPAKILMVKDPRSYRLAQCFVDGKAYFAQDFIMEKPTEKGVRRYYTCRVMSSERKRLAPPVPPEHDECQEDLIEWVDGDTKILLKRPLSKSTKRWTKTGTLYSIDQFLEGKEPKINALELYKDIEATFRKYYYTNEVYDYAILTLFTMFTYYYEAYDAVPYLYLNGPAGSGKTSICQLLKELCFNGELVNNISTASLYRQSEQLQMTLILDEQEGIASKKANEDKGDYLSVIKDAYKRTGSVVRQKPGDPAITEEFNVFSPIVIANIFGLESVVRTRTVQISTKHAPAEAVKNLSSLSPTDPDFIAEMELLRDKLYCWVMQNHKDLVQLPTFDIRKVLQNRAMEIFQPIMALAAYADSFDDAKSNSISKSISESIDSKLLKRDLDKSRDTNELLREACLMVLKKKGIDKKGQSAKVDVYSILDAVVELNGTKEDYMKLTWIGDRIVSNGWIKSKEDRKRPFIETMRRSPITGLVIPNSQDIVKIRATCYNLRYDLLIGG